MYILICEQMQLENIEVQLNLVYKAKLSKIDISYLFSCDHLSLNLQNMLKNPKIYFINNNNDAPNFMRSRYLDKKKSTLT